jgi:signal transduction histidine kinase
MVVTRWSPVGDLIVLHNAMDQLFHNPVATATASGAGSLATIESGYLPLDIYPTDGGWVVRLSVPGHDPEAVWVTFEGSVIRIRRQLSWPEAAPPADRSILDGVQIRLDPSRMSRPASPAGQIGPVGLPDPGAEARPEPADDLGKLHFLLRVSEELRQPLTLLAGYMEMIDEGTIADPRDVVPILIRKTAELNTLVTHLLERARAEAW